MKLHISFDMPDLERAITVAHSIADHADILEVGSLLILKYGIHAVQTFREKFPGITILADAKIVDRGKDSVSLLAAAGADWITVMAGAGRDVIHSACSTAHHHGKKIMLDLIDAPSPGQSAMDAQNMGVDALLFHKPFDATDNSTLLDQWDMVRGNTKLPIFVSAKIDRENISTITGLHPDGLVIGESITLADDPAQEARFFAQACTKR